MFAVICLSLFFQNIFMRYYAVLLLILTFAAPFSYAADFKNKDLEDSFNKPAEVEADSMSYDKNNSSIIASGNVEVTQGGRMLNAEQVVYNRQENLVTAEGNISLMEADGTVFFADKIELTGDLKKGVIEHFRAKFIDDSRMSADKAEKLDDSVITMKNIKYSPCKVCEEDPDSEPLWQVRANEATMNRQEQNVSYKHAFFDIKGIPILYTPYLSHPTPGADRKSGFLIPKYSTDKIFGTTVKIPYYYNIASNKDLTIAPIFTANEGTILTSEYRHMIEQGSYYLEGSVTNPDKVDVNGNPLEGNKMRGHIEGHGEFNLDDLWSVGFVGKRSTDDTYLQKYNFGYEDVLTSKAYTAAIDGRNFFSAETISFQGLKSNDDPGESPLIMPVANMHYETSPAIDGSKWTVDGNLLMLKRDEGVSSNRVSLKGGWQIPYMLQSGHLFEFKTSLRGDGYFVDDVPADPSRPNGYNLDGFTSRLVPQAELTWKYPLIRDNIYLEPTTRLIVSPYGNNPNKIHNEDSQDVEFSDENLFDANHFTGYDRIEHGPRVNYGLRGSVFDVYNGDVNFVLGQNYRTKEDPNFGASSGLDSHFSDYVGMIGYNMGDRLGLNYRFRVDNNSFSFNRNSVGARVDINPVKFDLDYLSVYESFDSTGLNSDSSRELIIANTKIELTDKWEISGGGNRNLEDGEWISTKANVLYKGDCVDVSVEWFKEFTRDRDIRPNTTLSLQISLKNLGY